MADSIAKMDPAKLATMPAVPPPPGTVSNFVDPPDQMPSTIALHTVCLTLVTAAVTMRLYTRYFITRQLGWDDYLCILAFALTIVFSGLLIDGAVLGLGRHLWDVRFVALSAALQKMAIAEWIYLVLAAVIRMSFFFFYLRIFAPSNKMRIAIYAGMAFNIASTVSLFFGTIFQCTPVEKSWNPILPGHCIPPKILPYLSGGINVVTDLYVLGLPIPCIWNLHASWKRKLRTTAVFGVGIFVCVTSIIRLAMTHILYETIDRTWVLSEIQIWAVIEVNVGIICACLMALPAFLERFWPKSFSRAFYRLTSLLHSGESRAVSSTKRLWKRLRESSSGSHGSSGRGNDLRDPEKRSPSDSSSASSGGPAPERWRNQQQSTTEASNETGSEKTLAAVGKDISKIGSKLDLSSQFYQSASHEDDRDVEMEGERRHELDT